MRIAYITSHIYKSLQWNWFSEELLKLNQFHIHIIINPTVPVLKEELENLGIKVYFLPHKNSFSHIKNLLTIIKILRKEKINVVHSELPYGNLLGQLGAKFLGISNRVCTCENASWAEDFNSKRQRYIDKLTYQIAKKVITITDLSREYLIRNYNLPSAKVQTIWHSLKIKDYKNIADTRINKLKKELGIQSGDYVIGMVARLEDWKGHIYAFRAMKEIAVDYPNVKLLIFGSAADIDYKSKLDRYILDNNLTKNIQYKGFVNDNIALYHCFDIHLHIPINLMVETFGITVIEGMISKVTQVVTHSGISHYTAKHLHNAYVVAHENSDQIREAITKLIESPELSKTLSNQAYQDAVELFDYKYKVQQHLEIYQS